MEQQAPARVQPAKIKPAPAKKRPFLVEFYGSALGKKYVMAISGIMLLGFVFSHMVGNLKVYMGGPELDHYGEFLREIAVPLLPRTVFLWIFRSGLIAAFILHIHSAYGLTKLNHAARPTKYQGGRDYVAANYASRTMRWSGVIFALFLVWHLADLTWGIKPVAVDYFQRGSVFDNLTGSLSRLPVAGLYIVANLALGLHLFHGVWSLFQTLGLNSPRFNAWRRAFATGFAAIIVAGNVSIPVAVLTGVVSNGR